MQERLKNFFKEQGKELTFLEVDSSEILGNSEKEEIVHLPFLLDDFKAGYEETHGQIKLTTPGIMKGIGYLFGVDPEFHKNQEYGVLLDSFGLDISEFLLLESNRYFDRGEKIKALVLLKGAAVYQPEALKSLFNYAITLLDVAEGQSDPVLQNEMKQEAKIRFESIVKKDPGFSLAYYHLGFLYKEESMFIKAKKAWENSIELGLEKHLEEHSNTLLREIEDLVQYEEGYHDVLNGKGKQGLNKLLPLEDRYPDWWNLLFFIGLAYRQIQDYPTAITYFQKVIDIEKALADPYVEIGLSFAGMGEHDKAVEYLEKGMKLDPSSHEIPCNLAMVHLWKGDVKRARKYIDISLTMEPDDEVSLACEKQIRHFENHQTL